jgi:hypothetical protein
MAMKDLLPDGLLDLLAIEEATWPEVRERIRLSGHPTCEGEEGGEAAAAGDEGEGEEEGAGEGAAAAAGGAEIDWKAYARKHEREAKKERKAREEAERKLSERDDADKSEHEKAVEAARQDGEKTAREKALAELRNDRLEVAVARLANGITVKDGDEEKTLRFADPEDAMLHIEQAIRAGDVDSDDIFNNEGKVQTDALGIALSELLERKPHLQAVNGDAKRTRGESDAGKGSGGSKGLEDYSVEDHLKHQQANRV